MKIECTVKELMAELQEWYEKGKAEGGILVKGLTNGEGPIDVSDLKARLYVCEKTVRKLREMIEEVREANLAWCKEGRFGILESRPACKLVKLLDNLPGPSEAILL